MPEDEASAKLVEMFQEHFRSVVAITGLAEREVRGIVLHKAAHPIPAKAVLDLCASAQVSEAPSILKAERASIRFPVNVAESTRLAAYKAIIMRHSADAATTGGRWESRAILKVPDAVEGMTYGQKTARGPWTRCAAGSGPWWHSRLATSAPIARWKCKRPSPEPTASRCRRSGQGLSARSPKPSCRRPRSHLGLVCGKLPIRRPSTRRPSPLFTGYLYAAVVLNRPLSFAAETGVA